MKIPSSIKLTVGGLAVAGLGFFGFRAYGDMRLSGFNPTPVKPGVVTLLAFSAPDYNILVQNQVAVLAQAGDKFNASGVGQEGNETGKRLKMREFLESLQGDPGGLGILTMSLNGIKDEDIPPDEVDWKGEDVLKAVSGDPVLKPRLESDLHETLDGTPDTALRLKTLLRGIVLDLPVPVEVPINGQPVKVVCRVKEPYMTKLGESMQTRIGEHFNPSPAALVGYYREFAEPLLTGKVPKEDVAGILKEKCSDERAARLAAPTAQILTKATVLVNEDFIVGAESRSYDGPNHSTLTDLTVKLTDEGKMRLWKYSHSKSGFQLLLIVDGVAIAAPRITTELSDNVVTITQLQNQQLAEDARDRMNKLAKKAKA